MKKVSVITGGAGGMGFATAKLLGKDQHVLICDVRAERLETAVAELRKLGVECDSLVCDITDRKSVDALVKMAVGLGSLASVIHTAGLSPQMASPEVIMKVNTLGTINITEAFYEVANEGFVLVNIASMAAHMAPDFLMPKRAYALAFTDTAAFLKKAVFPVQFMPKGLYRSGMAYSISKNFVVWYCRKNAVRFGVKGARILSISPGTFDTEMGHLEEKSGSAEMLKQAAIKRFGRPEEIAELAAFCISDKASYMTGTDILLDGGVVAGRMK